MRAPPTGFDQRSRNFRNKNAVSAKAPSRWWRTIGIGCCRSKKNGRATSGDRGGEPTVQVARPLLGDRRCFSGGGDCQRTIISSKQCASKKPSQIQTSIKSFFLFLRPAASKTFEFGRTPAKINSFASCDRNVVRDPTIRASPACIDLTAPG